MNTVTKYYGRDKSNNVVIPLPDISSRHAKITYLGGNLFEVEDLDSSNGTYVNGYRIKRAVISLNDQVRLSACSTLNLIENFKLDAVKKPISANFKINKKDFTEEFKYLEALYLNYKNSRKRIISLHQKKMAVMRV